MQGSTDSRIGRIFKRVCRDLRTSESVQILKRHSGICGQPNPGNIHVKRFTMNNMLLIKDLFGSKYQFKFNRGIDVFPGTSVMV